MKDTQEEYQKYIAYLNDHKAEIQNDIDAFYKKTDEILKTENIDGFIAISSLSSGTDNQKRRTLSGELVKVFSIIEAVEKEKASGLPVFIWNTHVTKELIDKYVSLNMMLRRIELDIPGSERQEAFDFIDEQKISPYSVQAVLYSMISILGHRQEIIMKIASWYLDQGNYLQAYMFLCIIKKPTADAVELRDQLYMALDQEM